ncbi:MAG: 4-(cytidine 5'-diphospho)-2-C-methyl-D-erythritol kinase, partial [Clostridia bacterium]|nr:4-(cytidine 5'-diphospho)-2-C-methyl-D-erythritol kinase [Clostridia bacterium]
MEGYEYSAKARAKINLSLDVGLRRPDGYHDLETVMHTVSLCDDVYMNLRPTGEIRVRSSIPGMPEDENNLAGKAVLAFNAVTGRDTGAEIYIDKRIPSEAGLGGGSSDAGAVLRLLGEIFKTPTEQLLQAAVRVGADVPFTMMGGCALCRGIGERMEPLPAMPACRIVIVKPPVGAPTGAVFAAFDREPVLRQDTAAVVKALQAGD